MAERSFHPALRLAFAIAIILLTLAAVEAAMRYLDRPRPLISGWRATDPHGPLNLFGYRGQPSRSIRVSDFVVVLTGGANVECLACPPDDTLDAMLERAVRQYVPNGRVVSLGAAGYGQDQAYLAVRALLARQHADVVLDWASISDDIPANTFRDGAPRPGQAWPKPTFALRRGALLGPTEELGAAVYRSKLSTLIRPWFIDLDRNWTTLLPKPDPGMDRPPADAASRGESAVRHVSDALDQQRSAWSIWLKPRPARVAYGIALTHALLRHMRELSTLHGARFAVLLTPPAPRPEAPIALEHDGHWYLADPATRDAAVAAVSEGLDTIVLPESPGPGEAEQAAATDPAVGADLAGDTAEAARRMMGRLADALYQRGMLAQVTADRPRH